MEAVYLNDDEALNLQTNEDHHLFQWLTLQARRGAAEAEVNPFLSSVLFRLKVHKHKKVIKNKQKVVLKCQACVSKYTFQGKIK